MGSGRRIRICQLSSALLTGGPGRLLQDFAHHICDERFAQSFVAIGPLGAPAKAISDIGGRVQSIASATNTRLGRLAWLRRYVVNEGIDVIHVHDTFPQQYAAAVAALVGGLPIVCTQHTPPHFLPFVSRIQFPFANLATTRIAAVSRAQLWALCRRDPSARAKYRLIYNGIDTKRFAPGPAVKAPAAVCVGRLAASKGFFTLLRIADQLRHIIPGFTLTIVGDGPLRTELDQQIHKLGLGSTVALVGEQSNVESWLRRAALFVSASIYEAGVPMASLEAMAVGLPIVAMRGGAVEELQGPNAVGRFVDQGDVTGFVSACRELLQGPNAAGLRAQLGNHARARVETDFDVRRMVADYQSLYTSVHSSRK